MATSGTSEQGDRLLGIYLNDHLMGATLGTDLARRAMHNNAGTALGAFLEQLHGEIAEDRGSLESLMSALDVPRNRLKVLAGSVAEKGARLKLNGRLFGYSDLSRLIELEGLYAGVDAKLRLWRTLRELAGADPRLPATEIDVLIDRAHAQLDGLEEHRLPAARTAFTP